MKRAALLITFFLLSSCQQTSQDSTYNAIVALDGRIAKVPVFYSLQAAINSAPENNAVPFRIFIAKGVYREKISLTKNNVQLIGENRDQTRILFGDYAGKKIGAGQLLYTPGSATLSIRAKDVQLRHLTIENNFDFLANDALPNDKRIAGSQAVALLIDGPSDRVLVRDLALLGYQDTLYVNAGRSWFDKVLVAGNVDYIFGKGNALFTQSEIKTLPRGRSANPHGYITAPSTDVDSVYGLTFVNCRLTRDTAVPDKSVPLGRPWHPTTQFADGRYADPSAIGKSVFINTWMDAHITTEGWYSMSGVTKNGERKSFKPEDSRFFEYKNTGPGAQQNEKRRQLTAEEINSYRREIILGDWKPDVL